MFKKVKQAFGMSVEKSRHELEVSDSPKNPVIHVNDLKEHLVGMYEYKENQDHEIDMLNQRIEELKSIEQMYRAALITLDEYKRTTERAEQNARQEKGKNQQYEKQINTINGELNSFKIRENMMKDYKEQVKHEVILKTKEGLLDLILKHKGNLSKKLIKDLINDYQS